MHRIKLLVVFGFLVAMVSAGCVAEGDGADETTWESVAQAASEGDGQALPTCGDPGSDEGDGAESADAPQDIAGEEEPSLDAIPGFCCWSIGNGGWDCDFSNPLSSNDYGGCEQGRFFAINDLPCT